MDVEERLRRPSFATFPLWAVQLPLPHVGLWHFQPAESDDRRTRGPSQEVRDLLRLTSPAELVCQPRCDSLTKLNRGAWPEMVRPQPPIQGPTNQPAGHLEVPGPTTIRPERERARIAVRDGTSANEIPAGRVALPPNRTRRSIRSKQFPPPPPLRSSQRSLSLCLSPQSIC